MTSLTSRGSQYIEENSYVNKQTKFSMYARWQTEAMEIQRRVRLPLSRRLSPGSFYTDYKEAEDSEPGGGYWVGAATAKGTLRIGTAWTQKEESRKV